MNLLVVSCYKSQLASDFANALDVPLIHVKTGRFADTEVYVDLNYSDLLNGAQVLLVHQFNLSQSAAGFSVNDQLMDLLLACDLLKNIGVKKITAILPYLAYSRQDESFNKKFIGPVQLLGHLFKDAGIDTVFSCDLHSNKLVELVSVKLKEISLINFWLDIIQANFGNEINKNNLCIVSPDEGGIERSTKIASILNVPVACIIKERRMPDFPVALGFDGHVKSKVAIIVDDIASTGRTAIQASYMLRSHGANKIIGLFSHAVFSYGAVCRLVKSEFDKIFVTDTLLTPIDLNCKKIHVYSVNKYLIQHISEVLD